MDPAEVTGEWWVDPWWEESDCSMLFTVPLEAVRRGAAVLRQHFDADWYKKLATEPRRQTIFPMLRLHRSTVALEFIASFGARLERLKDTPNLQRPIRALKETDGEAAFFELEAAEAFAEWGFNVAFPKEGGESSPDILAELNGQAIAIECKRLGEEQWEDWESDLLREISFALPTERDGRAIAIQVALNPRLSDIRFGSPEHASINAAIAATIRQTVLSAIDEALADGRLPAKIEILETATVLIQSKTPEVSSSVSGMERSMPAIFRKIFQNGILRALDQLPKGRPGVAVVFSKHAPPPVVFRLFFDAITNADPVRFSDLTGVLICTMQTWFERPRPTFYANAHTIHPDAAAVVAQALGRGFGSTDG